MPSNFPTGVFFGIPVGSEDDRNDDQGGRNNDDREEIRNVIHGRMDIDTMGLAGHEYQSSLP